MISFHPAAFYRDAINRTLAPPTRIGRIAAILIVVLVLPACTAGEMSVLDPASPFAQTITRVWWVMFWPSLFILAGVTGLALYAAFCNPDQRLHVGANTLIFGGGVVFTLVVITALLAYGVRDGEKLLPLPTDRNVFRVNVIAHQWWWEVQYPDADGLLYSANEVHVPAGRPIHIHLQSGDVIHSFWVPRLGGKLDAVPGQTNIIRLQTPETGLYRGQCAEFCGGQHARMALHVEVHEEEALAERLAKLAATENATQEILGEEAFNGHCARCHSLDPRRGSLAPNLADLSLRHHLGAGTLPNSAENLRRWLAANQALKPGNLMPSFENLPADTLEAIAAYLEGPR